MKASIKSEIIMYLAGSTDKQRYNKSKWYLPGEILYHFNNGYSRTLLNKYLLQLQEAGVVERIIPRPKRYDPVNWKGLNEQEKLRKNKDSYWCLKNSKVAFRESFKLLWNETKNTQLTDIFVKSPYFQNNKPLLYYLFNRAFFYNGDRPNIIRGGMKKYALDIAIEKEAQWLSDGLISPTFGDILVNERSAPELADYFRENLHLKNFGDYVSLVIVSCYIVDTLKGVKIDPALLQKYLRHITPFQQHFQTIDTIKNSAELKTIAEKAKPIKIKEESKKKSRLKKK